MKALAALLILPLLSSAAVPAYGPVYSGIPPERYWGQEAAAVTIYANDVARYCPLDVPPDKVLLGCHYVTDAGLSVIVLPNPCFFDMEIDWFARIACHEKSHAVGWEGHHPL